MTLLDESNIRNKTIDGEIWISLYDVTAHLLKSVKQFSHDASAMMSMHPAAAQEAIFVRGIVEGILSIVTLLSQGGMEKEFDENINTVEDLLKTIKGYDKEV